MAVSIITSNQGSLEYTWKTLSFESGSVRRPVLKLKQSLTRPDERPQDRGFIPGRVHNPICLPLGLLPDTEVGRHIRCRGPLGGP